MLWRPVVRGLAEAGRRGAAAGQRRGVGNLPVKPNEHVEKWGTMREHVEEQFKVGPALPRPQGLGSGRGFPPPVALAAFPAPPGDPPAPFPASRDRPGTPLRRPVRVRRPRPRTRSPPGRSPRLGQPGELRGTTEPSQRPRR